MSRRFQLRSVAVNSAVAALCVSAAGHAWAGLDHLEALAIAENHVPTGTAVKVQDERFDGVEWTYEVELVMNNGSVLAQVEMDAQTGAITQYDEFPQTNSQRSHWQEILALLQGAQLGYQEAFQRAYSRYPNCEIYESTLNIEGGRLEYDFPMVDGGAMFQIEVDAITGNIDDPSGGQSIDVDEAADIARADVPGGIIVKATLLKRNGNWEYKFEVAINSGANEKHIWVDEDNGVIKKRANRVCTATEAQKNQAVMALWTNATKTYLDAMWLARTKIGNARPKTWTLAVLGGRLKYKVIMSEAGVNKTAKVDARNGNVS